MKIVQHKEKIWSLTNADKKFSEFIRGRDKKCFRCGSKKNQLQNSHYWARQYNSTRFEPLNCIALCAWCHTLAPDCWQDDRNHEYERFMMKRLGIKGFEALKKQHLVQIKRRDAILGVMKLLKAK